MYLTPNSYHLQQPLGCWLPDYHCDYHWGWQICPYMFVLFHFHENQWWAHMPVCYYPTHIGYCTQRSPTSPPSGTVPATPVIFALKIHVPLPVTHVLAPTIPQPLCTPLATRLLIPLDSWAELLWYHIRLHTHMDNLWQAILNRIPI